MEQTQASLVLRGRRSEVQVPFRIPSLLRFGGTGLFPMCPASGHVTRVLLRPSRHPGSGLVSSLCGLTKTRYCVCFGNQLSVGHVQTAWPLDAASWTGDMEPKWALRI